MSNIKDYDNEVWEKFLEFVVPDERTLSRKEVQSELQQLGIDLRPAWEKIQMALADSKQAERARCELESAKKRRRSVLDKLKNLQLKSTPNIREELQKLIEDRFNTSKAATFYRKLESVSDEDLKSLLEDWSLLEEFSKDSNNVES